MPENTRNNAWNWINSSILHLVLINDAYKYSVHLHWTVSGRKEFTDRKLIDAMQSELISIFVFRFRYSRLIFYWNSCRVFYFIFRKHSSESSLSILSTYTYNRSYASVSLLLAIATECAFYAFVDNRKWG